MRADTARGRRRSTVDGRCRRDRGGIRPSKRQVSIEPGSGYLCVVPPPVGRVGVFVDADPSFVELAAVTCGLSAVQYHGDESPEACADAPRPVIKALKVGTVFDI